MDPHNAEMVQSVILRDQASRINRKINELTAKKPGLSVQGTSKKVIKDTNKSELTPSFYYKTEREWYENLRNCGIKILTGGCMGITRWQKDKNGEKKIIWQQVEGIDSAIRMQFHILDTYLKGHESKPGELEILDSTEKIIRQVNYLLVNWKSNDEQQKKEIELLATKALSQLGNNIRNDDKKNIMARIHPVKSLLDRLNKINPGAMAARTIGALNDLTKRLNQIGVIMPVIAMRTRLLLIERRSCQRSIAAADLKLSKIINDWNKMSESELTKNRDKMIRSLNQVLFLLNNCFFSPFYDKAGRVKYYLNYAKKMIIQSNFFEAAIFVKIARGEMQKK